MATKSEGVERGEYVIGIAVILAALLVSATIYVSVGGLTQAISGLSLVAPTQPTVPTQPTQPTQPTVPTVPAVVKLSGLDFSKAQIQGKADAKVMLVEYSDFQCPYCKRAFPTLQQVKASYPDLQIVYRHFPLSFHQAAQKAAEGAECAGAQGKFWEMHDMLFDKNVDGSGSGLGVSDIKGYAATLGLDTAKFNTCLDSGQTAATVSAQLAEGSNVGITGTPGFLIFSPKAKSAALEGKLQTIAASLRQLGVEASVVEVNGAGNGVVFAGALPYANFAEVMDAFN